MRLRMIPHIQKPPNVFPYISVWAKLPDLYKFSMLTLHFGTYLSKVPIPQHKWFNFVWLLYIWGCVWSHIYRSHQMPFLILVFGPNFPIYIDFQCKYYTLELVLLSIVEIIDCQNIHGTMTCRLLMAISIHKRHIKITASSYRQDVTLMLNGIKTCRQPGGKFISEVNIAHA